MQGTQLKSRRVSSTHTICRVRSSLFRAAPVRHFILFIRSKTSRSRSHISTTYRTLHRHGAQGYPSGFKYCHVPHQMSGLGGLRRMDDRFQASRVY